MSTESPEMMGLVNFDVKNHNLKRKPISTSYLRLRYEPILP